MKTTALLFLTLALTGAASADVRETQPNLIVIERSATITATPADAYQVLTAKVGQWWHPEHTWSGRSQNLALDAQAGGCFCEKLDGGGSVQHSRVVWAQPGQKLKLEGAFGPLQDMAVDALLTFQLDPAGTGTKVTMTFRASGAFTLEADKLAPLVDHVLGLQFGRFVEFANTGKVAAGAG